MTSPIQLLHHLSQFCRRVAQRRSQHFDLPHQVGQVPGRVLPFRRQGQAHLYLVVDNAQIKAAQHG